MSVFPDTGPQPDGTRTEKQWLAAMGEDTAIMGVQLKATMGAEMPESMVGDDRKDYVALKLALALKEVRRLRSDIYRYGREVHGVDRELIDAQGPL